MSIVELGLAGFRNYTPSVLQRIHFDAPLTLIWGKKGAGKTTIIEVLKYVTTGEFPESSQEGAKFIINPDLTSNSRMEGQLTFRDENNHRLKRVRKGLAGVFLKDQKGPQKEIIMREFQPQFVNLDVTMPTGEFAFLKVKKKVSEVVGLSPAFLTQVVFGREDNLLLSSQQYNTLLEELIGFKKKEAKPAKEEPRTLSARNNSSNRSIGKPQQTQSPQRQRSPGSSKGREVSEDKRLELLVRVGVLEGREEKGREVLGAARREMEEYHSQLGEQFNISSYQAFSSEGIDQQIADLEATKRSLEEEQRAPSRLTPATEAQIEVYSEIKKVRQYLTELSRQPTLAEVVRHLEHRLASQQQAKERLFALREKVNGAEIRAVDLHQSHHDYQREKEKLEEEGEKLRVVGGQICFLFQGLYRAVRPRGDHQQVDGEIGFKLSKSKARLSIKMEELKQCQLEISKHKQERSTSLQKGRRAKKDETGERERERRIQEEEQTGRKLQEQVQKEEAHLRLISEQYEQYLAYQEQAEQEKLNHQLLAGLEAVQIDPSTMPSLPQHPSPTIQEFHNCLNHYKFIREGMQTRAQKVAEYGQRHKQNEEAQLRNEQLIRERAEMVGQMGRLEVKMKNYDFFRSSHRYLKSKMGSYIEERPILEQLDRMSQVESTLADTVETIKRLSLIKKHFEAHARHSALEKECLAIATELKAVRHQLSSMQSQPKQSQMQTSLSKRSRPEGDRAHKEGEDRESVLCMQSMLKNLTDIRQMLESLCLKKIDTINRYIEMFWRGLSSDDRSIYIRYQPNRQPSGYTYSIQTKRNRFDRPNNIREGTSRPQQIVASIAIRLALIATFAQKFRFLCLDDPTAFLGKELSKKLAMQTKKFIESVGGNKLQILIVSKDQDFLNLMRGEKSHHYEININSEGRSEVRKKI